MNKLAITILLLITFGSVANGLKAEDAVLPLANYTFNSGTALDETGNTQLYLRNNCTVYQDSERGSVLRFSSNDKSYAVFNKQLLIK